MYCVMPLKTIHNIFLYSVNGRLSTAEDERATGVEREREDTSHIYGNFVTGVWRMCCARNTKSRYGCTESFLAVLWVLVDSVLCTQCIKGDNTNVIEVERKHQEQQQSNSMAFVDGTLHTQSRCQCTCLCVYCVWTKASLDAYILSRGSSAVMTFCWMKYTSNNVCKICKMLFRAMPLFRAQSTLSMRRTGVGVEVSRITHSYFIVFHINSCRSE